MGRTERIGRLKEMLRAAGLDAMLVSDPVSIGYLTGAKIEPFERMWLLLVFADRDTEDPAGGRRHSLSDAFAFVGFRTIHNSEWR